jgi:GTP-binding protein EngB required for normal cell division
MRADSGLGPAFNIRPPATPGAARAGNYRRAELAGAVTDAAALPGIDAEAVAWLNGKIADQTFNLVVAGQFKRGKSSIINALLGDRLLPVGVIPLTSVVTVIRSGASTWARAQLLDGRSQEFPLESLADYVTERGNPKNAKGVRLVMIEHPSAWLADGVQLIDTPGIGSVYEHNTDVTQRYLPQADAVLLIASVDQPMSRAELDFLAGIRQYAGKIFCLLNKIDYVHQEELPEALSFARDAMRSALGAAVPIFPVSARRALDRKLAHDTSCADSGFSEFEQALQTFMTDEKRGVWIRSIARSLLRILAQARFALELEAKILGTPLLQIEGKLAAFEAKRRGLESALGDYQVLMEAGARALIRDQIEPALEEFKRSEQVRIGALVQQWTAQLRELSASKLDVALEQRIRTEIRAAYDSWLAREDPIASAAFEKLCGRFWAEMQASVDELVRYSSELFSLSFEPVPDDSRWSPDSGFYYKFWYEPSGLATLSSSLVSLLPKFFSTRLIPRRRKAQAFELIEVQAGRLRYDFEQRVQRSAQDARRRMARRIEAALAGIAAAIEGATTAQQQGVQQVAAGMARIKVAREAISSLEARVQAVAAAE